MENPSIKFQSLSAHRAPVLAVAFLIVILVASTPRPALAITCSDVALSIIGCTNYAQGKGALPPQCCTGVRNLNSENKSTPDRQQTCKCLKTIIHGIPGVNMKIVSGIPAKCNVNIGYPLDPSTDCSKVK